MIHSYPFNMFHYTTSKLPFTQHIIYMPYTWNTSWIEITTMPIVRHNLLLPITSLTCKTLTCPPLYWFCTLQNLMFRLDEYSSLCQPSSTHSLSLFPHYFVVFQSNHCLQFVHFSNITPLCSGIPSTWLTYSDSPLQIMHLLIVSRFGNSDVSLSSTLLDSNLVLRVLLQHFSNLWHQRIILQFVMTHFM